MARPTFRVHFVRHHDGAMTGRLLSAAGALSEPFSGYAHTEDGVLAQLALAVEESREPLDEYRWRSEIAVRRVKVKVHPQAVIKRRHVISRQQIELSVTYFWAEQDGGGIRVLVPRFGWWFVLESMDMAPAVIRQAIGTALLGEKPRSVYEFRGQEEEFVVEWSPTFGAKRAQANDASDQERLGTLHAVCEELTSRERKTRRRPIVGRVRVEAELPPLLDEPATLAAIGWPRGQRQEYLGARVGPHACQSRQCACGSPAAVVDQRGPDHRGHAVPGPMGAALLGPDRRAVRRRGSAVPRPPRAALCQPNPTQLHRGHVRASDACGESWR